MLSICLIVNILNVIRTVIRYWDVIRDKEKRKQMSKESKVLFRLQIITCCVALIINILAILMIYIQYFK